MNRNPAPEPEAAIASAINLEYVRNLAQGGGEQAVEEVAAFHRSLFLHRHGRDFERLRQQRKIAEDHLADLELRLRDTRDRLTGENPHVPVVENGEPDTRPNAPWNAWDRTMFWVAAAAVVSLLVFGVFNISFNLIESGIITFTEHPVRAYLWAALLPVGALAVKIGWDLLESRRRRTTYLWTCLVLGVVSVLVWVVAYASVYPALSMTTEERIAGLSIAEDAAAGGGLSALNGSGVKHIDMIIVAAQALAEICLSAALGIYMTQIYARHRPVRLAVNPTFKQLDQERRALEERVSSERLAFAEALGDSQRLENQLEAFVAYAKSLFHKEAALRRDRGQQKRQLLDQITEQLRSRLAAADDEEQTGREAGNGDPGRLALDSR